MVTVVDAVTALVLTVNVALVAPAVTVTLEGTVATDVSLLESATCAPPDGAGHIAGGAGAVRRELTGEYLNAKRRWRSRHTCIISIQRAVRERHSRLGLAKAGDHRTVRAEEEGLIRTYQVGDRAICDGYRCAAIACHTVRPG